MADDDAISIIIPLYNKCDTIVRAVQSCVAQSLPPEEIIVVDDGSTDGSVERIPASLLAAVKVVAQPNGGVSAARNAGAEAAGGKLLAFLDADDELLPTALETYSVMARQFPEAGFFSGSIERISESGKLFLPKGAWPPTRSGIVGSFEREYLHNRALISSSSVCIRRKAFIRVGGFPVGAKLGEDIYLWLKLAQSAPLCHTGRVVSRVYRNAANRAIATSAGSDQMPHYLKHFLLTTAGIQHYRENRALRRLLFSLALRTLLGARQAGAESLVRNIIAAFRAASPGKGVLLALAARTPVPMISRLRAR